MSNKAMPILIDLKTYDPAILMLMYQRWTVTRDKNANQNTVTKAILYSVAVDAIKEIEAELQRRGLEVEDPKPAA